jgi:hypothetical protein
MCMVRARCLKPINLDKLCQLLITISNNSTPPTTKIKNKSGWMMGDGRNDAADRMHAKEKEKMLRLGIEPRSTQPQCVILTTIRTEPRICDGIKLIIPFFWCSSGVFWREGPSPTIQHPRSPCTSSFARIGDLTVCPPGFLIVRNSSLDFERRLKISRELFQIVALFI